jgi:hypothetical protein
VTRCAIETWSEMRDGEMGWRELTVNVGRCM